MIVQGKHYRTVWWEEGRLCLINQPLLPHQFQVVHYDDYRQVAEAIRTMVVRGAPAIGATGAFALALAAAQGADLRDAAALLRLTRPTAQDLFYAIDFVLRAHSQGESVLQAAEEVSDRYLSACESIGEIGAEMIPDGARINTHCNAGWLATVDWGTATAPMYKAWREGKKISVYVDETRPRCQGSRLTAFELGQEGIPHTVIVDNATGFFMARGEIDLVIVGSDRIALNGDVANKIGTYSSAVVARENGIPFYVAAPVATIDPASRTGDDIPIEERADREVTGMFGWNEETGVQTDIRIAPDGSPCRNPAFDVTPARLVTGIITEKGVFPPGEISQAILG